MKLLVSALGLTAIAPVALAGPIQEQQAMRVVFQVDKETSQAAITASNLARTEVFGQSCSSTLQSGIFADHPIAFETDETGQGTVTLGGQQHTIHSDPAVAGGITCGSFDSAAELLVTCDVTVPRALQLRSLAKRDLAACFPRVMQLETAMARFDEGAADAPPPFSEAEQTLNMTQADIDAVTSLSKRQYGCQWNARTRRVGDGNPHQNPFHIQLSGNLNCGDGTCSVEQFAVTAMTVEFRISPGAKLTSWISGGFRVERSHYTGNAYRCDGGRFETVCVWDRIEQTAYTVENGLDSSCSNAWEAVGSPFVMWSPNSNQGPNYYCVRGAQYCRSLGQGWLDTDAGRPGGPR